MRRKKEEKKEKKKKKKNETKSKMRGERGEGEGEGEGGTNFISISSREMTKIILKRIRHPPIFNSHIGSP